MATYSDVIDMVASLMNDTAQTLYTDTAVLPYLNMALDELQEIFGNNNISITNALSSDIVVPAGTRIISFSSTPALPAGLLEIQTLWETLSGTDNWVPMIRREFLDLYADDVSTSEFGFWAWMNQSIYLPLSNRANDLRIHYIASRIAPIAIGGVSGDLPVLNAKSYLVYHTASLCAMFIGENPTRAEALEQLAQEALSRTLGINNKGKQGIATRRRPFRASYKMRGRFA